VATTGSINSSDIRDLMIESAERRFGLIDRLPKPIELLSDNGSPYTAGETRVLARNIGLVPRTTPNTRRGISGRVLPLYRDPAAGRDRAERWGSRVRHRRPHTKPAERHASQRTDLPATLSVRRRSAGDHQRPEDSRVWRNV
jgi:transposase InsO family protein